MGKERGWPPATRAQFDALRGPTGALLIGDAETVARKVLYVNEVLGGLSRITFQMGVSALPHDKMLRSIELLGTRVAPIIGQELRALDRSPRTAMPAQFSMDPPRHVGQRQGHNPVRKAWDKDGGSRRVSSKTSSTMGTSRHGVTRT